MSIRGFGIMATCVTLAACATETAVETGEDDLTSLTARQRVLTFEGVVYVEPSANEEKIVEVARKQTQTAFGALLAQDVAVQSREVQNVDAASFRKRPVTVVDVGGDGSRTEMIEVRYRYRDNAVVPIALSRRTSLSLGLLGQGYEPQLSEIVESCTKNDAEARKDARDGLIWYDFNPAKASCRRAMDQEQRRIDADGARLEQPDKMVSRSRVDRVYLPVTMQLARAATATHATYPEYDRLFAGGVERGVLTVVVLAGRIAHERVEARKDEGYYEWMTGLDVIFQEHPDFALTKIEPQEDIGNATIEGKRYENLGFNDFIQWTVYGSGWPEGMPASSRDNIASTIGNKLDNHWVTFEKKVKVSIDGGPERELTIRLETLFGAEEDPTPHRRALKRGDVVLYNGHSYIGYGPLDPENFSESSFPPSYQMFFFDSCVSYNYYEKDFFTLKAGGSKNLDLVTNGLESPVYQGGEAGGKFIAKLIGGSMPSYQALLEAASATDSLRVVDGEIDNRYDPTRTSIRIIR